MQKHQNIHFSAINILNLKIVYEKTLGTTIQILTHIYCFFKMIKQTSINIYKKCYLEKKIKCYTLIKKDECIYEKSDEQQINEPS